MIKFFNSKYSKISECHGSIYIANEPFLLPYIMSTYLAVSLNTRSIGTKPFEYPFVPAIYESDALIL